MRELADLLTDELRYFDSDQQRRYFTSLLVTPVASPQDWQYGDETHDCIVIARNDTAQIVFCRTGFGPDFPWSSQVPGSNDLGSDGTWHAYLYEAFVTSGMWPGGTPDGFTLMAPGERKV